MRRARARVGARARQILTVCGFVHAATREQAEALMVWLLGSGQMARPRAADVW